jgi:hypothetical protein
LEASFAAVVSNGTRAAPASRQISRPANSEAAMLVESHRSASINAQQEGWVEVKSKKARGFVCRLRPPSITGIPIRKEDLLAFASVASPPITAFPLARDRCVAFIVSRLGTSLESAMLNPCL